MLAKHNTKIVEKRNTYIFVFSFWTKMFHIVKKILKYKSKSVYRIRVHKDVQLNILISYYSSGRQQASAI